MAETWPRGGMSVAEEAAIVEEKQETGCSCCHLRNLAGVGGRGGREGGRGAEQKDRCCGTLVRWGPSVPGNARLLRMSSAGRHLASSSGGL